MLMGGKHTPPIFSEVKWRPTPLVDLPHFRHAHRIGFDLECKDETLLDLGPGVRRPGNRVVGFSFAIEDGPKHYVPFAHGCVDASDGQDDGRDGACDNVEGDAIGWLADEFKHFKGELVGANLPYDLDWSMELGCNFIGVKSFLDVQVAQPLIYELDHSYSLENICKKHSLPGKNESVLREAARQYGVDPKGGMWRMPGRMVGPYAEDDAELPLKIMRRQERQIEQNEIEKCWAMECRLLPILVKMTRKGVRVDVDRLDMVEAWTKRTEAAAYEIIKRETGIEIPVGQSGNVDLLTRVLNAAGIPLGVTATGKDSVSKDVFLNLPAELGESAHLVGKALSRARQVSTIRTTFVNGVRRHLTGHTGDWRIHCSFNQIRKTDDTTGESSGVAYGRLSASHVNMQNQPGNSRFSGDNELGPMWRSIYKGDVHWSALDLKQQEPKWSFHYGAILERAGVEGVRGALALCQALRDNPQLDTYEPIVDLAGVPRSKAKVIWLARAYGKGDGGLCEDLGLPTEDVCFSRKIYYQCLDAGMDKYSAKSMATVPVDSPEGEAAMAGGGGGFTWKGAGAEGRELIRKFDDGMSFLKVCAGKAKDRAEENGFVKLLSGRRCHFELSKGDRKQKYEWTHKSFNRIIQGTAAEQTKQIMIAVDDAGYGDLIMLQVHDELDVDCMPDVAEKVAEVMRHAVPMEVPTVVDVECGPSWGESMGVEYNDASGKKSKVQYTWGMRVVNGTPTYFENPLSDVVVR